LDLVEKTLKLENAMKDLMRLLAMWYCVFCNCIPSLHAQEQPPKAPTITIGSKAFTESVILGEILKQRINTRANALHVKQLGGTRILWDALLAGEIDAYPEYTGTIVAEILAEELAQANQQPSKLSDSALLRALQAKGISMSAPLGFANTYALGMRQETAQKLGIRTISDLRRFSNLRCAFSNEFLDREDGWRGLQRHYGLTNKDIRGLEHDIAYRALADGAIDLTELYSTDAEIAEYQLTILRDDEQFFPDYRCVVLYRTHLAKTAPDVVSQIISLQNMISQEAMTAMNAEVKLQKTSEERTAATFLAKAFQQTAQTFSEQSLLERVFMRTLEHLRLSAISLVCAIMVAIPLGVAAAHLPRIGAFILGATGIIQTIPSLALLVMMIPLFGIGALPAIIALFLYSLLPIVRGTVLGIQSIPQYLAETAQILGVPAWLRVWRLELPLASASIYAGVKTSAVINIGTTTLGAIIGAGGHGQAILTGIRLADTTTILEGAIPAALLALGVEWAFGGIERFLRKKSDMN
jgi:osmoprotectant transport system permease protein